VRGLFVLRRAVRAEGLGKLEWGSRRREFCVQRAAQKGTGCDWTQSLARFVCVDASTVDAYLSIKNCRKRASREACRSNIGERGGSASP
jgi:hypothetical protein